MCCPKIKKTKTSRVLKQFKKIHFFICFKNSSFSPDKRRVLLRQNEKMCKNALFEGMAKSLVSTIKCQADDPPVHIDEVDEYLKWVRRRSMLHMDCFVVAFGYLYRLVENRRIKEPLVFTRSNWRLLVITAIMIAQKFSDDESYPNNEFAKLVKPEYTIKQLNKMEVTFLVGLNWNCSITPQEYQDYYRCIWAS